MELTLDNAGLRRAMARGPATLSKHMDRAIGRIVLEMANAARQNAPKATSQLTGSIITRRPNPLEGLVEVGAEHGLYVEVETGPQGLPPVQNILDWINVRNIQPNDPDTSEEDLAYLIARRIATRGIKAQPFLQPAFDDRKAAAERRMNTAIDSALREMGAA